MLAYNNTSLNLYNASATNFQDPRLAELFHRHQSLPEKDVEWVSQHANKG